MLQTVLSFAIPTVVTLAAAFYILRQAWKNEEHDNNSRYTRNGTNKSNPSGHGRFSSSSRRQLPAAAHRECAVCFDNKLLVGLYPCGHKSFCADCINKIITASSKVCPLCRSPIQGYSDR